MGRRVCSRWGRRCKRRTHPPLAHPVPWGDAEVHFPRAAGLLALPGAWPNLAVFGAPWGHTTTRCKASARIQSP